MTELTIPDDLAERLQAIAKQENRPVSAVLKSLVEQYQTIDPLAAMDGMFDDELEEAVIGLKKSLDAQNTELLMLIAEYDRRKISSTEYELSTTAWLKFQCRMSATVPLSRGTTEER